jgi:hypothetical protein
MARLDEPLPRGKGRHHFGYVFAPAFIPGSSGGLRQVLRKHAELSI